MDGRTEKEDTDLPHFEAHELAPRCTRNVLIRDSSACSSPWLPLEGQQEFDSVKGLVYIIILVSE